MMDTCMIKLKARFDCCVVVIAIISEIKDTQLTCNIDALTSH